MKYSISVDTGGTFTDVVIVDEVGAVTIGKSLTTHDRVYKGINNALDSAAEELGISKAELLKATETFIYGTTHAINSIVTGKTAKTAFLTTEGFPDILVRKEGGKFNPHDFSEEYPEPYIPRSRTFEIQGRITSEGEVMEGMNTGAVEELLLRLKQQGYEAIAVCLLWSVANPEHELILGEMIENIMPGTPYTLSHKLVSAVREYRRASAAAIDASLKPLMQSHLREMEENLRDAGYTGDLLVSTSSGGCCDIAYAVERPIHVVKSGPSMAPVAARAVSLLEGLGDNVIVADTGGTTFDAGLVRDGEIKFSRESWLGKQWTGHIMGVPSVDMRSLGAGGGSIAWIDSGGLLCIGPQSAGSYPGPVCYGNGGKEPTVTDAAVVLGYLDPEYFLGGRLSLDVDGARAAIKVLADQMGLSVEDTAFGIIRVANEAMISAIHDITISEGLNPAESTLVAGGGAAGINIAPIAKELGCERVVLPKTAGALSAYGMQFADIVAEETRNCITNSDSFSFDAVNKALRDIEAELLGFRESHQGKSNDDYTIQYFVEARYAHQVWELEIPLPVGKFESDDHVQELVSIFHKAHERVYAVSDETSIIECLNWKGRLVIKLDKQTTTAAAVTETPVAVTPDAVRKAYFGRQTPEDTSIYKGVNLQPGTKVVGPAIIEEPTTTIVVYPGMSASTSSSSNYILEVIQ